MTTKLDSPQMEALLRSYGSYLVGATRLSPRTREVYLEQVRRFVAETRVQRLADISPQTLLDWQQARRDAGQRAATLNQKHSALKSFFRYLEEFAEDPHAAQLLRTLRRMEIPKDQEPRRDHQPYSMPEDLLDRLLLVNDEPYASCVRNKAMIHFLWSTGVRNAELARLQVGDLDLEQRTARVTGKGDKTRIVVFDQDCRQDLRAWLSVRGQWAKSDYVFISLQSGKIISNDQVLEILKDSARRAGIKAPIWTHLFRHTRITRLLDAGMPIQDVAMYAGHNSINTTMMYFHKGTEEMKRAYDLATESRGNDEPE
jgi:integrase/recombinase XerC